ADSADVPGCASRSGGHLIGQSHAADPSCAGFEITDGARYLAMRGNGTWTNFTGDLATAARCMASVGTGGCMLPQPLAAMRAALGDGANLAPASGNEGFLRDGAVLLVVFVSSGVECSAPNDSALFDPGPGAGPLTDFRCAQAGIACGGAP